MRFILYRFLDIQIAIFFININRQCKYISLVQNITYNMLRINIMGYHRLCFKHMKL